MKLTQDECFRTIDQVTDFLYGLVGQQVEIKRTTTSFCIEYRGHGAAPAIPNSGGISIRDEEYEFVSLEQLADQEGDWLPEDGYDDD